MPAVVTPPLLHNLASERRGDALCPFKAFLCPFARFGRECLAGPQHTKRDAAHLDRERPFFPDDVSLLHPNYLVPVIAEKIIRNQWNHSRLSSFGEDLMEGPTFPCQPT